MLWSSFSRTPSFAGNDTDFDDSGLGSPGPKEGQRKAQLLANEQGDDESSCGERRESMVSSRCSVV
jgi:hypothetical protein